MTIGVVQDLKDNLDNAYSEPKSNLLTLISLMKEMTNIDLPGK